MKPNTLYVSKTEKRNPWGSSLFFGIQHITLTMEIVMKKLKWEKSIVYLPSKTIRYVGTSPQIPAKYIIEKHGIKHYQIGYYKLFWGTPSHFYIGTAETLKEGKQVANTHYQKGVKHG